MDRIRWSRSSSELVRSYVLTYAPQVSTALAAGVVVKALAQRPNFYSAAVYLAQSSANLMVSWK